MKIIIETPGQNEEDDEIIIRCRNLDDDLLELIYRLREGQNQITGYRDKEIVQLPLKNIYYFEAVDNKVFAYCEKQVYEVKLKLYQLDYSNFIRVSKSVVLNLSKIKSLSPLFNGKLEVNLKNGEKVIISRQYVPDLKKSLGITR